MQIHMLCTAKYAYKTTHIIPKYILILFCAYFDILMPVKKCDYRLQEKLMNER